MDPSVTVHKEGRSNDCRWDLRDFSSSYLPENFDGGGNKRKGGWVGGGNGNIRTCCYAQVFEWQSEGGGVTDIFVVVSLPFTHIRLFFPLAGNIFFLLRTGYGKVNLTYVGSCAAEKYSPTFEKKKASEEVTI